MNINTRYGMAIHDPSDIRELIPVLRKYGEKCQHITEFGIGVGNSAIAWIASKPKKLVCYDIGRQACVDEIARLAQENGIEFVFHEKNTANVIIEPTDLLFIDTVHNAGQLQCEFVPNARLVNKFVIMHDTHTYGDIGEGGSPGMWGFLFPYLALHAEWRLLEHRPESNGLTVLERISP